MLDRDSTYNNIIDRIDRLEARVEDLRDVARPSEVVIYENAEWQALAGWVSTGSVLRSLDGEIILDPSIPMIQVGTGGYIQSEDFVTGVSGFQINGGTAEFNDVVVRGTIYADLGEIGGWVIGTYTLTADAGAVGLNSEATGGVDWRIWAGNAVPANAPFRVDESGNLVATSATITGTIDANAGHLGSLDVDGVITVGAVAPYIEIDGPNKRIESSTYAAGISGMQIQANGDAEFNNVRIRGALTSAVFVRDLVEARAGSMMIVKSGGPLATDMAVPGSGTWTMNIEDPPGGGFLFANGDICRCKTEYAAGVGDIWFMVSARADNGDGTQRYTCTYSSGTRSITYPAGAPVLDYGVSGDGGLYLTADHANGPFLSVFTHAGTPWTTLTERVRLGNLNGVGGYGAAAYGIFIGDYSGNKWLSYDPTNSLRIRGDALIQGTVSADKLTLGDYDLFFSVANGLALWTTGCAITPTSWTSTRGQVATITGAFHQVQGPWAESRALVVEPAATNLITNPRMNSTAGWNVNGVTTALYSGDMVVGQYSLEVTKTSSDSWRYVSWERSLSGATAGLVFTFSVYIRAGLPSDVGKKCHVRFVETGGSTGQQISADTATITLSMSWQRVAISHTVIQNDRTTLSCRISPNYTTSTGDVILIDAAQLEERLYVTSYLDGSLGTGYAWSGTEDASTSTRASTTFSFNPRGIIDLSSGSLSIWFQMPYDAGTAYSVSGSTRGLFRWWDGWNTESFYVSFGSDFSRIYVTSYTGSVSQVNIYASLTGSKAGDWHHVVVTTTTNSVNLYLDGVLKSTDTSYAAPAITSTTAYLGYVTASFGGAIAEFASFSRVLTAEEVAALYVRGKPLVDSGALTKPGIYILDGLFKLASSTTGLRTELTAAGLGVYNGAGLTSVGRVLVGMVDTTGTVLDETATDLGMFGYDAADTLQVAWYASGANAGKMMAGGDVVMLDEDGIAVEISTAAAEARAYKFLTSAGALRSGLYGYEVGSINYLLLKAEDVTGEATRVTIQADAPAGKAAAVILAAYSGARAGGLGITVDSDGDMYASTGLDLRIGDIYADGVGGGIVIGSTAVNPDKGAIHFIERSSDPTEPGEGFAVIWMSDGTGKGDDGDVLIASKAGGSTTYAILFDHSAGSAW